MFLADDIIGMLAQLNREADELLLKKKIELQNTKKNGDASLPTQAESAQKVDSQQAK